MYNNIFIFSSLRSSLVTSDDFINSSASDYQQRFIYHRLIIKLAGERVF